MKHETTGDTKPLCADYLLLTRTMTRKVNSEICSTSVFISILITLVSQLVLLFCLFVLLVK